MSNIATARIQREFKEFIRSEEVSKNNIKLELVDGASFTKLKGEIVGPPDTPYENGRFKLDINISELYPFHPPKIKFLTKIWHPNISSVTGAICLDVLKDQWAAAMTLRTVLLSIQSLLASPEPDDPQDAVVAQQYKEQHEVFLKTAKHWTITYANGSNELDNDCQMKLQQLLDMGFDKENSTIALSTHGWLIEKAVEALSGLGLGNRSKNVKEDLARLSAELKNFYLNGEISKLQPPFNVPVKVDLIHKYVDLCIVDAEKPQMDADFIIERKKFLEKQMSYTPTPYSDIFMNEKSVMLISGIAGIGKTWFLRKCLLNWSNNLIWNNVELVFYLECRRLNQYQNIFNINELINVFYKDIINDFDISKHTALFIIDGLDEFKYINELLNPSSCCTYPIVNALAEVQNYKHVVAGRVYAIDQYQNIYTKKNHKLTIQIMGFNENGINNYVENHVNEEKKEVVKRTLKESPIAKAMASVPFYLSSMCEIISDSNKIYTSFSTMTDLYANVFLYFLQKHIIKNNGLVYQMMENEKNKKYVLNICRIAFELFVKNKFTLSKMEFLSFINDIDGVEESYFGLIEKVKTNTGCYYQFAHLAILEFCTSVYAYNCLSSEEIMANETLKSCLSMICGLANKNQNSLLKFLVNLNPLKKSNEESLPVLSIFDRLLCENFKSHDNNLFIECFYESQSSFTNKIKSIVTKRKWCILIDDKKTTYATSCENYFLNLYIKSRGKLAWLEVDKNVLRDEERNLIIKCSTNVRNVKFHRPIQFERWKPKKKIQWLLVHISNYIITKSDFKENFLPWINLCKGLELFLHDDIDFIDDIFEWIRCSNIKEFLVEYRGKYFVTSIN
ncbi:NACHT, LRR and PYD domains-containing protein 13 [Hydra vulgaris]|uniref:NACHT, LRR and PYD domains-containing protein 13 n=1 Tax=Hydra vulgaris TaxID=6087 RepID=UPI001F5ED5E7|nr:NACHT, LRR and PYD domains-containing protein 13-like [Hydra vulgaris]